MTTKTTRRPRRDSTAELARVVQGATQEIHPPSHVPLDDSDWPYWHSVVDEFARSDWTEHQLEIAAMLARTMSNLELAQRTLRSGGMVIKRENGTEVESPWVRVVKNLSGDVLSYRRSLCINIRSQKGGSTKAASAREANKATERKAKGDDELFA